MNVYFGAAARRCFRHKDCSSPVETGHSRGPDSPVELPARGRVNSRPEAFLLYPYMSALIFLLLPLACLLCALLLRPSPARAERRTGAGIADRDGDYAAMLALPFPIIIVESRGLRLHAANGACIRELRQGWTPGLFLPDLFVDADKVEDFLKKVRDSEKAEENGNAATTERFLGSELPCLLKAPAGNGIPLSLSPFFIERRQDHPSLMFLTANSGATLAASSLRRSFDSFPEMLFFRDREGRFLLCNAAFRLTCGKQLHEILGKTVQELDLSPPLPELLCAHDHDIFTTGLAFSSEMSSVNQGRLACFENHSYPDIAPDGSIRGIFTLCRDVSLAKVTAEALQRQGALLQATNDAALLLFSDEEDLEALATRTLSGIGTVTGVDQVDVWRNHGSTEEGLLCTQIYSWNKRYTPSYFSPHSNTAVYSAHLPGWEALLSSGECVDTSTRQLTTPEREHLEHQGLKAVLAVPIIFRSSFWGFIRLGVRTSHHDWGRGEEAILRSVGLLLAATIQRRQIQEALSESEERFRDVTMAAGEIIWELNAQGYFSYVSERVFALTGYQPEEVRGMRWEDFALDIHDDELTGHMFQASVPTGSFRALEHRIKSKDGKAIWLFTSGKLLLGPEGIAGLRGTSLDITHDKQTAENLNTTLKALENANKELEISAKRALELARKAESVSKAKSEFLANMSHEVRTPLNAIIGMAYLMQKTSLSVKQEDYINKIHAAGITLLGVVNDILDFSKIESGKLEIEHVPFELDSLFENVAFIIGAKAEEQGLDVAFNIRDNVPRHLIGDPLRIGQVLTNLVGNAVKFTKKGGIEVRCILDKIENGRAYLRFIVHDTGIGISEEQQGMLFQSFSQGDSSITRKYGGTGLGLAISKNLLQLSGGSLSLESAPGEGTTITVLLPLEINKARIDSDIRDDGPLTDMSVILVDPSDMQRAHLFDMLQDMGCKVKVFSDMGQGFAAIAGGDGPSPLPRVLILPMGLVEEESGSNIRHLRENMRLANVPRILAIAPFGYGQGEDGEIAAGSSLFQGISIITRPVLSTVLRASLEDIAAGLGETRRKSGTQGHSDLTVPYLPDSRVLLVEDNPVNQQIATELLREAGISVTVAENGRIAVDLLESSPTVPFDVIFMDLQMPEMDGFTATALIRANPRLAFLPIIAMTAHATVDERLRCLEAGMSEHLSKPIDVGVLYEVLRVWLKPAQNKKSMVGSRVIDDSPLPELPGLDVQGALARLGGDLRLYKTDLLQFCLYHSEAEQEFNTALSQGYTQKALRLVISVLQHAEILGAGSLIHAARALEPALARDQLPNDKDVQAFRVELTTVIGMIQRLYPEPPASELPTEGPVIEDTAFLNDLAKLNALLDDDDAAACQVFDRLEPHIKRVSASAAATAGKALSMFDFALALSVLAPMEKNLSGGQVGNESAEAKK